MRYVQTFLLQCRFMLVYMKFCCPAMIAKLIHYQIAWSNSYCHIEKATKGCVIDIFLKDKQILIWGSQHHSYDLCITNYRWYRMRRISAWIHYANLGWMSNTGSRYFKLLSQHWDTQTSYICKFNYITYQIFHMYYVAGNKWHHKSSPQDSYSWYK